MSDALSAKQGMLCPRCAVPLALAERQGVEIDYCPQCRGVWLDSGELDKIADRLAQGSAASPPPANSADFSPWVRPDLAPTNPRTYGEHEGRHGERTHYDKHNRRQSWIERIID